MALTVTVTEDLAQQFSPSPEVLSAAKGLLESQRIHHPGVSADGTWLLADCAGSGKAPYQVSVDFIDPAQPTFRCSCPSRSLPCKHGIGLLLAYAAEPNTFGKREPLDDLIVKREKKVAGEERKKAGAFAPRKPSKVTQDKKTAAQREGLEQLEQLLVELVAMGQWFQPASLDKIEKLSKHLSDSHLPLAMFTLRRLMLLAKQKDLTDELRSTHGSFLIGQLAAILGKARTYLENRLDPGETQSDANAVLEDLLGKTWQISELKEMGLTAPSMSLFELAYERSDDEGRQQRVETSSLLDLSNGTICQGISYRPFKGLNQIPEQPSFQVPVTTPEVAIHPGFINRRIRWEKGAEQPLETTGSAHLQTAYGYASSHLKPILEAFRNQLKHPLAPQEAVFLLRCDRIGKVGEKVVLEDAEGDRIEAVDRRKDYSNVGNLVRAAGMFAGENPAILIRLFYQPVSNTIAALPLAALTPKQHLRLGL